MSIFKKKTATEKLFEAIEKHDVKKVRELLGTGEASPNALNKMDMTPLDACVEEIRSVMGTSTHVGGLEEDTGLALIFNTNLIWDELVRKGGTLKKYKDDSRYNEEFKITMKNFGRPIGSAIFKTPRAA